jgi:hypothetical protein
LFFLGDLNDFTEFLKVEKYKTAKWDIVTRNENVFVRTSLFAAQRYMSTVHILS